MNIVSDALARMIEASDGNQYDIGHVMKVWGYARTIGQLEGLDDRTQLTLELAAVVHDIACPDLRREHGHAPGHLQEEFGPDMARDFYEASALDAEMLDRICYLVGHHHSFANVDGMDYQILLEADFLVNAGEDEEYHKVIDKYRENVFRTETGIRLLEQVY